MTVLNPLNSSAGNAIRSKVPVRKTPYSWMLLMVTGLLPIAFHAQFTSVTNTLGIPMITTGTSIFGHAVSVCDFDGDGLDDISFGTTDQSPRFYRNIGNGFELMGINIESPTNSIKSILWVDIDNDGDRDLFISYENASVRLYENDGAMNLTDITASSGILMENNRRHYGAAFGDYDNDGFLDLYICKYYNTGQVTGSSYHNILYRNNGDNTFTNVTAAANASVGVNASFMATWFDYNEDGWLDLFIVNDRIFNPNHVLRNNGDGTFTEVAATLGLNAYINAMSCSLGDYNNDLLTDIFVANSQDMGNHCYEHQYDHTFHNMAEIAGVETFLLCWSSLWLDYDNDGDVDLHVAAEHFSAEEARNRFYINNGNETFTEAGIELGLANDNRSTWATAQGDWNMDGYPDFVSHNRAPDHSVLWQNNGGSNSYIAVNLTGSVSNRDAIGARVYCYAGAIQQLKSLQCGENYLGQNSHRLLFGLGGATSVDSVVVKWPSGHIDKFFSLAVNSNYSWVEGNGYHGSIICDKQSICVGDSTLLVGSGNNLNWSNGIETPDSIWVSEPGLYWYTATTSAGVAFTSEAIEIQVKDLPTAHWAINMPPCAGAAGEIGWLGEFPAIYSIVVDNENVNLPISGVYAGEFPLALWSTNGCVLYDTLAIVEPEFLTATLNAQPIECFGGTTQLTVEVTGGSGEVNVSWGAVNPLAVGPGAHNVVASDAHGCTATDEILITQPDELMLQIEVGHEVNGEDGNIFLGIAGGTPPYNVSWVGSDGFTSSELIITNLADGIYTVIVTDTNGCTAIESVVILPVGREEERHEERLIIYPNPFYSELFIGNLPDEAVVIELFSLDGRKVWSINSITGCNVRIETDQLVQGNYILFVEGLTFTQRTHVLHLK